ncbi:MAG: hypothetical protein QG657_4389 [Acidobacteriota bacterium]|nr:hypothetical protein [Acidobacteriota bacterium]
MKDLNPKRIANILALTPVQEGMLFHYLQDPQSELYFEQLSLEISGEIDVRHFEKAWNAVVETNAMLRTVFRWEKVEKPSQIILKEHKCNVVFYDMSDKDSGPKKTALEEIKTRDRDEGFDLTRVPFRVILCKLDEKQYEMVVSNHHIIYDGWSNGIILKEFFMAYIRLSQGEVFTPPVKPEFKEFVRWLQRQDNAEQDKFWGNYLKETGTNPYGPPAGKRKKTREAWNTANVRFQFPGELENKLGRFIKNNKITTASLLYGAWGVLLQKYHSVSDIIFDATVSGRSASAAINGIESIVGLFINTLPLRIQTLPGEMVSSFLSRMHDLIRQWSEFENSSPLPVREILAKQRRENLFDLVVVFENYPLDSLTLQDTAPLSLHSFSIVERTLYDLTVIITTLDSIELNITYNSDLFDRNVISRLFDQLVSIVEEMVTHPGKAVSEIDVWAEGERETFLEHIRAVREGEPGVETAYMAPRDEVEEKLVEIWSEVLNIDRGVIGIDHNFFDFGGHSLKASRLVSRLHRIFEVKIPLEKIFNSPTIRSMAGYIRAALKQEYVPIPAVEEKDYYDVSPGQMRFYMLQQLNPGSTAYNGPWSLMLDGPIDKEQLEESFKGLIRRHETLRTSFELRNGETVQWIHDEVEFEIEYKNSSTDYTDYTDDKDVKIHHSSFMSIPHHSIRSFIRPFDLSKAPLMRVGLLEVGAGQHILVVDMHHIITDGTSSAVLAGELSRLYRGEDLPPLKIQYKDFSQWQNRRIAEGKLSKQEEYWLDHLSGELPVLNLPNDFPRPLMQSFAGERISFEKDDVLAGRLHHLLKETGATLYMVLLSILNIVLGWYCDREDIIVGTPIAGRNHLDVETTVGFFLETMAIRNRPAAGKPFTKFLHEVKSSTLSAHENQDYPFSLLIKHLSPTHDLSRNPLFDVMLNVLNQPGTNFELEGVNVIPYELDIKISKVDMTLEAVERYGKINFELEYCTALFKKQTMERFVRHFLNTLREILFNPGIRLGEIEIITEDEKRQILEEFNKPAVVFNEEKTVIDYFEISAAKFPDCIAVIGHGHASTTRTNTDNNNVGAGPRVCPVNLTYRQLNEQSDKLAGLLIEKGVLPDTIEAIMMDRSIEMIIGIFGILKAGGAYLPIDPEYPQERIDYMLKDSGAQIMVGNWHACSMENHLSFHHSSFIVHHSSHLAYLIYTSGSTGKPKGVMVRHKNLMDYIRTFQEEFKLKETDVVLQQASFTFDLFVEEVYPCILAGGTLAIPPHHVIRDTARLVHFIACQQITVIDCAPLLLNELNGWMETGKPNPLKTVRIVISGGDVLKGEYVTNLLKTAAVYNTYGPTETTVCAAYHRLTGTEGTCIPIGKPISNYRVYIFDNYLRLLPPGVMGEICIDGVGVTSGYLNRPELTCEKFVAHELRELTRMKRGATDEHGQTRTEKRSDSTTPPITNHHSPLYRTGDLGKWLPDGSIEFIGRKDRQVKIRGYRIELGEIETRLLAHEDIKEVSVICIKEQWLCAYFTARKEKNIKEMREFLSRDMPAYMIPAYFVQVEQMPIGAGGKINIKALPKPTEYGLDTGVEYVPPIREIEYQLVTIWQELLQRERIGTADDFFNLGGDSILVNRCIARIREEIQVEIPLRKFFERPFIKALAEEIEKLECRLFAIPKAPRDGDIPLSFSQERLWFLQNLDSENTAYFVPRVIRVMGKLEIKLLEQTFTEIIRRHEILRTVFVTKDGIPVQQVRQPYYFNIPIMRLNREEVADWLKEEGRKTFDFEKGPLLRVTLLRFKEEEHLLVLTEHHLIHDGWTQGVLLNEFIAIFTAYSEGKQHNLPELPIQYADYAIWQRSHLQGERLKGYLDYWQEKLSGLIPVLELPGDRPRPPVMSGQGELVEFHLSSILSDQLKEFSRKNGVTLFMIMLAVFKTLLYRYTGEEDICVGTGIANRGYKEMEGMLGMVINTLPLRTHTVGELTFTQYLNRVKETCLEAYQNQDTPFGNIVELMQPERNLSYTPLFQVLFSFMDTPGEQLRLPGLELELLPTHNRSAKFDINVVVVPPLEMNSSETLVEWEYNIDIFDGETMERMNIHHNRLLEEAVSHPGISISKLSMLGEEEINRLLHEFNDTASEYPRDKTIHRLFEEQVEKTPDHVGLVGDVGHVRPVRPVRLTYRQLNELSNRLAGFMIEKGVRADTIVGIMGERSVEMIIGILGILKSGGAYLPIDPAYPQERIDYMLKDSGAKFLVTTNAKEGETVGRWEGEKILLEFIHHSNQLSSHHSSFSVHHSSNLAYVIYTSGTTGQSKGSLIEHRNVVRLLFNDKFQFDFSNRDVWTLFHSFCFDFSVWEMYGALLYGGKLLIVPKMVARDTAGFLELLTREAVTVLNQTPSAFYNLINEALSPHRQTKNLYIKYVIFGGEALNPLKLKEWLEKYPHTRLINMFGITETTVHVTYKEITQEDVELNTGNIGKPIPTLRVYILDRYLKPVPVGVTGEICVGGDGGARGYLNRPELTAEKFIYHSPLTTHLSPIYRSGDLARFLANGDINYLGRIDHQVKIRGFRVELGEIEHRLSKHTGIKELVVVMQEEGRGDKYLCAYVVSNREYGILELREFLSVGIPDYMIPSYFVRLEKIPLTPNGKLDRIALPKPGMKAGESYTAPRNEIET